MLLLYNQPLCQNNVAIQRAYAAMQSNIARRMQLLVRPLSSLLKVQQLSRYYDAGRSCAAAVLATPLAAREAVRHACMAATAAAVEPAAAAVSAADEVNGASTPAPELGTFLCLRYQPFRWAWRGWTCVQERLPATSMQLAGCRCRPGGSEGVRSA